MSRKFSGTVWTALLLAAPLAGCEPGGVGDPCTPEDEYLATFSGFSVEEVNVESRSFQCETRICLVNHFQGRVSCPYGNNESERNMSAGEQSLPGCVIPGSTTKVTVAVDPQVAERQAADAVYCSCRCDGPDANARYCECPSGYSCTKLVDEYGFKQGGQLAGSYCIRENTEYTSIVNVQNTCRLGKGDCGKTDPVTGEPID